jgi:hypothetical protein
MIREHVIQQDSTRQPQQRQHETRQRELARSREKRVDALRERRREKKDRESELGQGCDRE